MSLDAPKFTVGEVDDLENGLRRVSIHLSDDTLAAVTEAFPHGNASSMVATITLPPAMLPFTPGQTCGFAVTEQPS